MNRNRRTFLSGSIASAMGYFLANGSGTALAEQPEGATPAVAKSLIILWMNGGASHIDTFDPKKGDTAGPFKSIATSTPNLRISEHLPTVAAQAKHLAVIRGMTSKEGNHQRARHLGHTGYAPNPTVDHPSMGAWVSHEREALGTLPSFISVGAPSVGAGFLGMEHAPFFMRKAGSLPDNVGLGFGVDEGRFRRRVAGLNFMEKRFAKTTGSDSVASRQKVYERAQRMMRGKDLSAFDLDQESSATRAAYGDTDFGRGCLLARRLVETGVPVVEVTQPGWDTHFDTFGRSKKLMGALDPGMGTLISDLHTRGLLDSTLVLWMGDFGRTPRINGREGRDHFPKAWSAVLAGGGIRGGVVHGATNDAGDEVVDKPTTVSNLMATVASQMGLDPSKSVATPGGRPIMMTDHGYPIADLIR